MANVLVSFLPNPAKGTTGPRSAAVTDSQGRFHLRSEDQREGAIIGWHVVVLEDMSVYSLPRKDKAPPPAAEASSRVPPIYSRVSSSPLSVEIKPAGTPVLLELLSNR